MKNEETGGRRRRRRTVVVAASAGLLLAGAGTVGWAATQQVDAPPAPPVAESSSTAGSAESSSPSTSSTSSKSASPTTKAKSGSSPSSTVKPLSRSKPTAVRIPGIDVEAPVHGLGLDAQGQLTVPSGDRYDEVGWYDGSPTPGETGPAVLEGHVTGSGHDPSVFFELGDTRKGDRIEVDREDGSTATFEVTQVKSTPKDDFPRIDVYGATDGPELRVITCGGTYDESAGRHLDNVIVFAELVKD